jgi:hypothetical protein
VQDFLISKGMEKLRQLLGPRREQTFPSGGVHIITDGPPSQGGQFITGEPPSQTLPKVAESRILSSDVRFPNWRKPGWNRLQMNRSGRGVRLKG